MIGLGIQSKREITRTRIRVSTAMATQVREQGRYQGGRPPYGYRLVDAGPHPNRAHAAWGRRARRLEPDPETAPIVKWIFAQRLAGHSIARITRALNDTGIPCLSAADPERNAHRSGHAWTATTVRTILANPRYTGRQVWNRQPSAHDLIDPANTGLGHRQVQRRNLPDGWVISARPAPPALVSEADFIAVRNIRSPRGNPKPDRRYLLAGLLRCGVSGRRMESCWANNRAAYRCRHGHTSASKADPSRRQAFPPLPLHPCRKSLRARGRLDLPSRRPRPQRIRRVGGGVRDGVGGHARHTLTVERCEVSYPYNASRSSRKNRPLARLLRSLRHVR
jgi:hypothetical protein